MIANKNFAYAPICKTPDGGAVTKSFNLKIECLRCTPVWQTLAREGSPAGKLVPAGFFP